MIGCNLATISNTGECLTRNRQEEARRRERVIEEEKKRGSEDLVYRVRGGGEEMDHSVIRLTHCQKEIFCFSVPEECPSCGEELRGSRLQEAPVSLPSPFHNGHKSSCCLLVAPAQDNVSRYTHTHTGRHTGHRTLETSLTNMSPVYYSGNLMGRRVCTLASPTLQVGLRGQRSAGSTAQ